MRELKMNSVSSWNVIIVDDEPDIELLLRQQYLKKIRSGEWELIFAENGVDAAAHFVVTLDGIVVFQAPASQLNWRGAATCSTPSS